MSKGIKYLFIVIGLLVVLFVTVAMILPKKSYVERSIVIDARPDKIYDLISHHEQSLQWSPWAEKDPTMSVSYDKGATGLNATMYWKSENPDVGSGSSTFIALVKDEKVAVSLDFGDMMVSTAEFNLLALDDGKTEVVWGFNMTHANFISRYFGLIIESLVGPDFERGLKNLKNVAESKVKTVTEEVNYNLDGVQFSGYFAYPDNDKKNPGVIIVHEWWGHNTYVRQRAEMLAELGYAAFALDMYGDGKLATHPEEAKGFMMEVVQQQNAAATRFDAALKMLKNKAFTDSENIAAVGYCFGGAVVLSMARLGKNLKGVVSFHGALAGLPPVAEGLVPPALVFNGAADPFISAEDVSAFKSSMDAAGANYEFISYPNVKHSFTNPGADEVGKKYDIPLQYNQDADTDSWDKMQRFFDDIFQS